MANFSSSASSNPHDWENIKENTAPISRGRRISSSSSSSTRWMPAVTQPDLSLLERKEQYEQQIIALSSQNNHDSSSSNDPLQIWVVYLKFLEDEIYVAKSVSTSAALFRLYEQCVHYVLSLSPPPPLLHQQQPQHHYHADRRFVRICCLYADASHDPLFTFYDLHTTHGIGAPTAVPEATTHVDPDAATALYFNAWAYTAESWYYFTLTQCIFQTGLQLLLSSGSSSTSKSTAIQSLQLRHVRFQKRMHRYWRNYQQEQLLEGSVVEGEGTPLDTENPHYRQELLQYHQSQQPPNQHATTHPHASSSSSSSLRGILHPLSSTVHRHAQEPPLALLLPPSSHPHQRPSSQSQPTFTDRRRRHRTDQENVQSQPPSSFVVFSDTAPEPAFPRHRDTIASTRPTTIVPITEAERYKENQTHIPVEKWNESGPLRNNYSTSAVPETHSTTNHHHRPLPSSSLLQTNTAVGFAIHVDDDCRRQQQAEETARQEHLAQHRRGRDERQHAPSNHKSTTTTTRPMWKHRLLTHPTTRTEQSFEEARYQQGYYQVAAVTTQRNALLFPDPNRSDMEEEEEEDGFGDSVDHSQLAQNTSTNSSTYDRNDFHPPSEPTINTQFAMRELSFMFASPVLAVPHTVEKGSHPPHRTAPLDVFPNGDDDDDDTVPLNDTEIPKFAPAARRVADPTPFTIYEEGANNPVSSTGFAIFCDHDSVGGGVGDDHCIDGTMADRPSDETTEFFPIPHIPDHTAPLSLSSTTQLDDPFPRMGDGTTNHSIRSSPEECHSHGDTATFPLLLWSNPDLNSHPNIDDDETVTHHTLESPLAFGNISVIVPSDDTTTMIPLADSSQSYRYMDVHTRNINEAATRLKGSSSFGSLPRRTTLARVLSKSGCVYNLPTCVLPRSFKQGTVQVGTEFVIDACPAVVDQVITQTSNETVVILREGGIGPMALKSQSPMECLAWEYHILRTICDRIPKEEHSTSKTTSITTSPFPNALSFVILADGAMLSTSTGSKAGWNLINLKRAYDAKGDEIPEVLILHFTARMLQHIEMLHWHAKILHCNVKPENWILTYNWSEKDKQMESDLMLVDFGRAVDLADINRNNRDNDKNWMDQVLTGGTIVETAKCVSMRLGLPWSFDIDTFGICACVYLLMHGTPFDIQPTKEPQGEKRWEPIQKFPRHFQSDLWKEIFDTLLNLDEDFGRAIGSRPYSLKRLRQQIEVHLQTGHNVALLDAAFRNQCTNHPAPLKKLYDIHTIDDRIGI